jgi:hypothetical protein
MKAGALYLTLTIAIIVTTIIFSLFLYIFHQKIIIIDAILIENKIKRIQEGKTFFELNRNIFEYNKSLSFDIYNSGSDSLYFFLEHNGIYDDVTISDISGDKVFKKKYRVGNVLPKNLSIYITDRGEILSITTDMNFKHSLFLPKQMYKPIFSNGANPKYDVKPSLSKLPEIDASKMLYLDRLLTTFSKSKKVPTKAIDTILSYSSRVIVSSNFKWNNVLLIAPSIIIENGFKGNLQCVASDSIVIGNNVELSYPSGVCLIQKRDTSAYLLLKEKSKVSGGVIVINKNNFMQLPRTEIQKLACVEGILYNQGRLKCMGIIQGSLFTEVIESEIGVNIIGSFKFDNKDSFRKMLVPTILPNTIKRIIY